MGAVLNQSTNRRREAKAWLKENPADLARWLEGVTTRDGKPADPTLNLAAEP